MISTTKKREGGCPIAYGLDTFGDRWSLLIIREMMLKGKKTYSDMQNLEEGIATNILTDRLKELEADLIIEKSRNPEDRRGFIYSLTKKGVDLAPLIIEMIYWSGKYNPPQTDERKLMFERINANRQEVIHEIYERFGYDHNA